MDVVRRLALLIVAAGAVAAVLAACGDDGDDDPSQHQGSAARAVATFFEQERAGGVLPEGLSVITAGTGQIRSLDAEDGEDARICVEYRYRASDNVEHLITRVYVAALQADGWDVTSVKDDGTCEDEDVA